MSNSLIHLADKVQELSMSTTASQPVHVTLQPRLESLISSLYPQRPVSPSEADALFSYSIQLLPLLNNPLNIELLSRHILQSPAIWIAGTQNPQRHLRIVSGFRSSLGWKVKDIEEGKGGVSVDEWIVAIGRGAIRNAPAWRHILMFTGLRSAITDETNVQNTTKKALEHAYLRALFESIGEVHTRDIVEATLHTLALMEYTNPSIVDQAFSFGKIDRLLLFLVDAMYSPSIGYFSDIPNVLSSLDKQVDFVVLVQELDSHILQTQIPRISSIISRAFPLTRDPSSLFLALDTLLALTGAVHASFSSLSEPTAQRLVSTDPSLSAKTDILPLLWDHLKILLFGTIMSLQGVITTTMHSRNVRNDYVTISLNILEILRNFAFVSARFGYASFDEWNFVYLASIDLLSASPTEAGVFVDGHLANIQARHPAAKADSLYFLDTLEQLIPILPPATVRGVLFVVRYYLQPLSDPSLRAHLESAHSVFLAILARGDILPDQILPYLEQVYTAFPQALTPRQVRLALSTVVKLSPPDQVTIILTRLLQRVQNAQTTPIRGGTRDDEQLTYFLAFVDCLPWIETEAIEFWLNQLVFAAKPLQGGRRDTLRQHMWECISGVMGGESGLKAVEWWVNNPSSKM